MPSIQWRVNNNVEILDITIEEAIQNQVPKLNLESVLSLSARIIEYSGDLRESEPLALIFFGKQYILMEN